MRWASADQRAFECAAGAALHALAAHPTLGGGGCGALPRTRVRQLLRAAAAFFERTTLPGPGVQWFWCLHALAGGAGEGEEAGVPAEEVRAVVESVVFLHRVRWAEEWAAGAAWGRELQYGLLRGDEEGVEEDAESVSRLSMSVCI